MPVTQVLRKLSQFKTRQASEKIRQTDDNERDSDRKTQRERKR